MNWTGSESSLEKKDRTMTNHTKHGRTGVVVRDGGNGLGGVGGLAAGVEHGTADDDAVETKDSDDNLQEGRTGDSCNG